MKQTISGFDLERKRTAGRTARRGFTLIEVLVATLIMMVALTGLVATWAQMMRTTLVSDNRGSAYEVAKQVMERSRSIGYTQTEPLVVTHPINSQGDTTLTAPLLAHWRFFDVGLKEIILNSYSGILNTNARPNAPAGAIFCVQTTIARTDSNTGDIPNERPDLQMLAIQVDVYDARFPNNAALCTLRDALTTGGI